jgi:hypothetical protein
MEKPKLPGNFIGSPRRLMTEKHKHATYFRIEYKIITLNVKLKHLIRI